MRKCKEKPMAMRLDVLAQASRGVEWVGDGATVISGLSEDSRKVQPGFLFASLKGARSDGADFVDDAMRRGAVAVLTDEMSGRQWPPDFPVLFSREPRATLADFASMFYSHPSHALKVVGVTGTNGKTTTTYLIKQLLESQGMPTGWIGTVGYALRDRMLASTHTTPGFAQLQSLLHDMRSEGLGAVSMEVSSHALEQRRADAVAFDVAVFTNLTRDHLDYHGDISHYLRSKIRLFELLNVSPKKERCAILPVDDPFSADLRAVIQTKTLSYGVHDEADVRAMNMRLTATGAFFDLATPQGDAAVSLPLLGRFNVANALAASAAAMAMGIDVQTIAAGLGSVKAPPGRMEFVSPSAHRPFQVVVDYAHTDDALRKALTTLREITAGRVLVVFGCGGDRDKTKRPLMGRAAEECADLIFLTSDNPRNEDARQIIREIEAGIARRESYRVCVDRAQAVQEAIAAAQPGDVVLIAGKGHEETQVLRDGAIPFSDRAVAAAALAGEGAEACKN